MKKINEKVVAIPPTVETRGLPCNDIREITATNTILSFSYNLSCGNSIL